MSYEGSRINPKRTRITPKILLDILEPGTTFESSYARPQTSSGHRVITKRLEHGVIHTGCGDDKSDYWVSSAIANHIDVVETSDGLNIEFIDRATGAIVAKYRNVVRPSQRYACCSAVEQWPADMRESLRGRCAFPQWCCKPFEPRSSVIDAKPE